MQTASHKQTEIGDLQASLDAYLNRRLEFAEVRTRWTAALADNPEIHVHAADILDRQPSNKRLSEEQHVSLKRIVESASFADSDDWTVVLEETGGKVSFAAKVLNNPVAEQAVRGVMAAQSMDSGPSVPAAHVAESHSVAPNVISDGKLLPGLVLMERFELMEPLGRGGIGIVYRALDRLRERANLGSAEVALKILRHEFRTNDEVVRAFQQEVLQAQRMAHPNMVRVYELFQDGENCFMTMELLKGELLRTVFSRLHPVAMPLERAMRIIAGMCSGLAHAHAGGLVHADFKPGNVFLTSADEPKILDFGLARVMPPAGRGGNASEDSAKPALQVMTPAYASCNRLEGGAPTFRDDVYSLSCVIYELLAGRHPYEKNSALVAREQKLQPDRIDGLTDVQWDTLATGLGTSQQVRTTEVRDLLAAFSNQAPLLTASQPARNLPVRKERRFARSTAIAVTGILLGAGIVSGMVIFDIGSIPSQYIDRARESAPVQQLQAVLDYRSSESITPDRPDAPASRPEAMSTANIANPPSGSPLPAEATEDTVASADDIDVTTVPLADSSVQSADEVQKPQAEGNAMDEGESAISVSAGINENLTPVSGTPGFELSSANYVIRESGTVLAVQIVRQGDLSTFASVEWSTYAGSAKPQLDYAESDRRLEQFAAGESTKTILVPIVSDSIVESDEDFWITLGRPSGDMDLLEPFTASVTIIDDDG